MAQSKPIAIAGHAYDAATIDLLGAVLDETWAKLSQLQQAEVPRTRIAEHLLKAAADGERDPDALRLRALEAVVSEAPREAGFRLIDRHATRA
jgi:hypothetical protein